MNKVKIAVGLILICGTGGEYINASRQLSTFLAPEIIVACLLMILLSSWLIGSGLMKEGFKVKSFQFLKYCAISFLLFTIVAFFSQFIYKGNSEIIKANGIEVNISEFMNGMKRILPNKDQRMEYCICVVNKLTQDKEFANKYKDEFKSGNFSDLIQAETSSDSHNISECMNSLRGIKWTPEMEKAIRANLIDILTKNEMSKTNDINSYCDCTIEKYKELSMRELSNPDFSQSQKGRAIDSICNKISKIK
jgi:mRNA-degrading endonuclease YafQ of YafQ-DinJ toxin-antitoxin module